MAKVVVMPKLGLTMKEGTLVTWNKKEGDEIKVGEVLFEISTDKLSNDFESSDEGIVRKLLVNEGDVVECLKPVAIIGSADEDISSLLNDSLSNSESVEQSGSKLPEKELEEVNGEGRKQGRIKASPAAKKVALENNIDITLVEGTGPQGRITIEDVEKYIESSKNKVKASPMASKIAKELNVDLSEIEKDGRIMKEDIVSLCKCNKTSEDTYVEKRVPMSQMRKVIASRMHESWVTSPTVTYDIKVDMTNLKRFKDALKDVCKVTYTDLLVKIVSKVLLQYPLLNCSVDGNELILRNFVNMGIAVALDEGLVVPVIKCADQKGLEEISTTIKELADKAKKNALKPDEITGGTFTITNLGMYGIEYFSPIINQPEVAILGVNKITETPIAKNGEIVIKPLMNLSLTADHRAVDGSVAAQFLSKLKGFIEKPEMLIL
ncbi:dihydrolipoamide acetyltransferase family protein [Clostridium aciditolerans]|uniref:Dihydrolipoamide acetyltransferase component of pyruvate dehydrogenase complex n=1 Tax=Clostridium aciditolerans TaxID=339861 RepID=A0A934M6K8_9CLOT|nr:dihydrolipoamide acetyltransferase family protein [Clostridium aciditolerans]MBI6874708.1 2-oxo acid dehydrogenase subunit E2 [Clostridium aciditolerans]